MILNVLKEIGFKNVSYVEPKKFTVTAHSEFYEELKKEFIQEAGKLGYIFDKVNSSITKYVFEFGTFNLVCDDSSYTLKIEIND